MVPHHDFVVDDNLLTSELREMNLERRIKRMSDAGFVMEETASHQSGLIVDSNVDRDKRDDAHYSGLYSGRGVQFNIDRQEMVNKFV